MRIVVHDYSGHPGQVHLSRELARRGYEVEHQFCSSYTTGRGATERRSDDPESFMIRPVALRSEFARYAPVARVRQEFRYAFAAYRAVTSVRPEIAVLSNVPLISLVLLTSALRLRRIPYVFWQQDVYSHAIGLVARSRFGHAGRPIEWLANVLEAAVARGAAAVVPISDTFTPQLRAWGVPPAKISVIPNWAAIDEMPCRPKDNAWARQHGLSDRLVAMYAGTLGLKHDPSALAKMARMTPPGTSTVVVSQGLGRDWLERQKHGALGLILMDYQPYEQLPEMLASADVLVVLLERDASKYSVPSKVLNYLCAGRPIVAVLPADNAVARTVEMAGAGIVVEPGDHEKASAALNSLLNDKAARDRMGRAARSYAERSFDVQHIVNEFETVLGLSVRV